MNWQHNQLPFSASCANKHICQTIRQSSSFTNHMTVPLRGKMTKKDSLFNVGGLIKEAGKIFNTGYFVGATIGSAIGIPFNISGVIGSGVHQVLNWKKNEKIRLKAEEPFIGKWKMVRLYEHNNPGSIKAAENQFITIFHGGYEITRDGKSEKFIPAGWKIIKHPESGENVMTLEFSNCYVQYFFFHEYAAPLAHLIFNCIDKNRDEKNVIKQLNV
jgi:hypothetical protein